MEQGKNEDAAAGQQNKKRRLLGREEEREKIQKIPKQSETKKKK